MNWRSYLTLIGMEVLNCLFNTSYANNINPCETCAQYTPSQGIILGGPDSGGWIKLLLVVFVLAMASVYLWKTYHKKVYPIIGSSLILLVIFTSFSLGLQKNPDKITCAINIEKGGNSASPASKNEEFKDVSGNDDFMPAEGKSATTPDTSLNAAGDEFVSVDSLSGNQDSFVPLDQAKDFSPTSVEPAPSGSMNLLYQITALLLISIFISLFLRYNWLFRIRELILLSSVVYLGFYKGACPCMIMSFQNVILFLLGNPVTWIAMLWFLALIPLTYFFGKVWCGWVCHLGGLQEFLFRNPAGKILQTRKAQRILKYIQITMLVVLLVQLLITKSNLYVKIDPFKVAFNLISVNITGYILLAILLITSVFIYRPFCSMVCPVGLILGWVSCIPGAKKLNIHSDCNTCKNCVQTCPSKAIHQVNGVITIDAENCILCGKCLQKCKKKAIQPKFALLARPFKK